MTDRGSSTRSVAVLYLARAADGLEAFGRFASSYRRHPAGSEHELIVAYKGFTRAGAIEDARKIFSGIHHVGIELADAGFDIGSYIEVCQRVQHTYVCFLNTHTEVAATGWLVPFVSHGTRPDVGLVGAMGSYESIASTVALLERVIVAACTDQVDRRHLVRYFDFLLPRFRPDWYGVGERLPRSPPLALRGARLIWQAASDLDLSQFPRFPNPHIRSNGFFIRRSLLLSGDFIPVQTKGDANIFESGVEGLTAQIRRAGLTTLVVGRDGRGYDVPAWPHSRTFRLEDQANLLVTDNHTRAFATMSESARMAHRRMTWGNSLGPPPADFPDLGVAFDVGAPVSAHPT